MKVTYDPKVDILRILFSNIPIEESDENKPGVIIVFFIWIIYTSFNLNNFFTHGYDGYAKDKNAVMESIARHESINYTEGDPRSYLYYVYQEYPLLKK